ncbi:MAG: O-antigen ligase family protein [Akkermansia sp.]|nr:O-antigen ligase family protein [Akkermansia sp.]
MTKQPHVSRRLAESRPGYILGGILAVLWITAMSAADSNACTLTPFLWGLAGVVVMAAICILMGYKVVRLPLIAWVSLAAGGYYLARAYNGFSLTDNWADIGLICFAFVYYLAGVYGGQRMSSRGCALILGIAVAINIFYLWLLRNPDISLHWVGRTDVSLIGTNTRNVGLFVYKNFAGLFLALSGSLLLWRNIWRGKRNLTTLLGSALGIGAIVASFFCDTRAILLILPLLLISGWILWLILKIFSDKELGWIMITTGVLMLTGAMITGYEFLFGDTLLKSIFDSDSHLRFHVWEYVNNAATKAPLWGFGPGGSTWEIVTTYREWQLPNYAHNEYLQMWADYGLIGLGLMLLIIVLHIIHAFLALSSDFLSAERRVSVSLALLCLGVLCCTSITDYVWHNAALISMGAFACGTLASPFPHRPIQLFSRCKWKDSDKPVPVKAEGRCAKVILSAAALALAALMLQLSDILYRPFIAQWQYDAMIARGDSAEQCRAHLLSIIPHYPHSKIADEFILRAPTITPDWTEYEKGLRRILEANPRQLFTASILAQCLSKQYRFEDAEKVYRHYYAGDGPDNNILSPWATFYTANLQLWGMQHIEKGDLGTALSMLNYAEKLSRKTGYIPTAQWRSGVRSWVHLGSASQKLYQRSCKTDLATLRAINPPQNHSWQQPMTKDGKPALYSRYQK